MKKFAMAGLMSATMMLSSFAPTFAATTGSVPVQKASVQTASATNIQKVTVDKQALKEVAATSATMNKYISMGKDGLLHIDAKAHDVVSASAYAHYKQGVESINNALKTKQLKVENNQLVLNTPANAGGGIQPQYTFTNPYWWGYAVTFDEPDTKNFEATLTDYAIGWGTVAGIAGLIPGAQAASAAAVLVGAGCALVENQMVKVDQGNGDTLNIHWIPTGYVSCNAN